MAAKEKQIGYKETVSEGKVRQSVVEELITLAKFDKYFHDLDVDEELFLCYFEGQLLACLDGSTTGTECKSRKQYKPLRWEKQACGAAL